jgi:hypothetical protein
MGQYHKLVNLDKHEFVHHYPLGCGAKLWEQLSHGTTGGVGDALLVLLAVSNGRGGGDFPPSELVGRWGGDRIAIVGDYAEDTDLPEEHQASTIILRLGDAEEGDPPGPRFRDITPLLVEYLEEAFEIVYVGDGWRERHDLCKVFADWKRSHKLRERVAKIGGKDYPLKALLAEARARFAAGDKPPFVVRDTEPYEGPQW